MANHCYNYAVFSGTKEQISKLNNRLSYLRDEIHKKEYTEKGLEIPSYLATNLVSFYSENFPKLFLQKWNRSEDVYEKFGSRWFECEWILDDEEHLTIMGDSAWSPVLPLFEKICKHYNLKAYGNYEEPGMNFAGEFEIDPLGVNAHREMTYQQYQAINNPNSFWEDMVNSILDGHYSDLESIFADFENCEWELTDEEKNQLTGFWEDFQESSKNETN
jgi:hypothetical protein